MPIKRYTVGDGSLTIGSAPLDITAQVTSMRVEWSENVTSSDSVFVLSGEETGSEDEVSYTAQLAGNVVQDIDAAGLVEYSWTNKGTEVPFVFVPNTSKGREVTGVLRVSPVTLGGDVRDRTPRSDISWACIGDPVLGDVTP